MLTFMPQNEANGVVHIKCDSCTARSRNQCWALITGHSSQRQVSHLMSSDYIWSLPCWRRQLFLLTKTHIYGNAEKLTSLAWPLINERKKQKRTIKLTFISDRRCPTWPNNRLHAFIEQWRAYFIEQWGAVPTLSRFSHVRPFGLSLPGSSFHRILQARTLEWVTMRSSRGSFQSRDQTHVCYVYLHWQWVLYH